MSVTAKQVDLQIKRQDGAWGSGFAFFEELGPDGFGVNAETRASARGIVAAMIMGCAVRDSSGRARTILQFSGYEFDQWLAGKPVDDPVLRAFVNPRDGSIRMDKLEEAAKLLLATER